MFSSNRHLTDREILQALDRELTEARLAAVERHLEDCRTCRVRHSAIASVSSLSSADHRSRNAGDELAARSRALLEAALAREAAVPGRPWLALTPAVALAAVVVMAAVASSFVQSAPNMNPFAANHRVGLPVASLTPGATWDVTLAELCSSSPRVRSITAAMRAQVVSAYGVENVPSSQYELDYLVTPELGGATDVRNLWPQKYASSIWNARG